MTRIVLLAAIALCLAAGPAAADPVSALFATLVTGAAKVWAVLGASVVGRAALQIATGLAASAVSRLFRKDPPPRGVMRQVDAGGDRPMRVLLGHYASAGHVVWSGSHGQVGKTPNAYFTEVILLSVLPIEGLDGVLVNGAKIDLGDTPHPDYGLPVLDFRVKGQDYLWVKFYNGSQVAADPMLLAKYAQGAGTSDDYPWSADMIGLGCAYVIVTTRGNNDLFGGQVPQLLFETRGIRLYDRRRDSTAGGDGPQRLDDRSTWAFSANPQVALSTILTAGLGWGEQHLYGPRWPAHTFPTANLFAALNACDVETPGADDVPEPMFRFGADLDLSTEPRSFARELLKCSGADTAICEGKVLLHVGPADAPVASLTDADFSVSHAQELEPFKGLEEAFNAASATYPDPAQTWTMVPAQTEYHPDWEAEDGGRRVANMPFPYVPWDSQVQRLVEASLRDQRRQRVHRGFLGWRLGHLAPLDYVAWTSDRNGYEAKLFKIVSLHDHPTGHVEVLLLEEDLDDYDPPALIPHDPLPPVRPVQPAQVVPGWSVAPYTVTVDAQDRRAGILAGWDPEAAEDARGIRIAVRRAGETGNGVEQPLYPVATGGAAITEGLLPGAHEVRAVLDVDRPVEWTGWTSVDVPAVGFGLDDLAPALVDWLGTMRDWIDEGIPEVRDLAQALAEEAQARADAVQAVADELAQETDARAAETQAAAEALRAERDRIRQIAGEVIELAANDHAAREEIRRSVQVQLGDMEASFDEQILTLANADFALAARLTTLEATSDDLSASITQVDQARIDGDNALASLVAAVAVGTAQQFDHAAIWYFDSTAEGWTGAPVAPSAVDGWLRPGIGSSAVSPSGLGVEAAMYAQVRARIRVVGSPVWLGQLWWAGAGQGWDEARRVALDEPAFSSEGVAEITFTPGWSGVIDAIRLDLADGADGSNYYELDWIAIGRPSPGASSAELLTEQQARISADSALASSFLALEASLNAAEGAITGNADAIEAIEVRVTDTEAGLEAAATSITALEASVNDDATGLDALASAVDSIAAEVGLLADGSQYSYAEALRNLQSSLRGVALEGLNAAARDETERRRVRDYVASATQALNTRVDATDSQVTINAEAITKLGAQVLDAEGAVLANAGALDALTIELVDQGNALDAAVTALTALEASVGGLEDDLATRASASALNSLGARVTNAEGAIDAVSSAVTGLEAEIGDLESSLATRASASAVSTLTARVTAAEGEIDSLSSAVTALESGLDALEGDLATRASASALNALTTRVTTAEGQITANASAITELSADLSDLDDELATRASAWALNQLSVEVSEIDGELSALASSVTALESSVDDATAGTTFKMETVAGPGGYARIGMMARYGSGYGYKEAGLFIDVSSDWNTPSRVGVHADQFVVATGSGLETPFFVSDGQVFMDWARIANVSIGFGEITGALQSDNYAEVAGLPVAGFRLDRETGQIRGKEVISREILELGAATDFQSETYGGWYPGGAYSPGWQNLLVVELGPTALGDMWTIVAGGDVRLWQYTDNTDPQAPRFWLREGLLRLVRQTQAVGSAIWGPERQIVSFAIPTDSAWSDRNAFEVLGGVYANVRYALQINTRTTGDATPPSLPSNHRNLFLSAERRVK